MIGVSLLVLCFTVAQATHEPMNNPHLFQGDMVLSPEQQQALHSGDTEKLVFGSKTRGRWPNARVPYQIESSIDSKTRASIMKAIEQYHKHTCLRFHRRNSERSYVSFYRGNGCHSPVGMNSNGPNRISLGPGCDAVGTALHEIGHSMGFFHEQNRPDRNSYIKTPPLLASRAPPSRRRRPAMPSRCRSPLATSAQLARSACGTH